MPAVTRKMAALKDEILSKIDQKFNDLKLEFLSELKDHSNTHRKTPTLVSLFNKVAGLQSCNFIKKRLQRRYFPAKILKFFKKSYFEEHLSMTAFKGYRWYKTIFCNKVALHVNLFNFFI